MTSKLEARQEKNFKIRDEKCGCTGTRSCLICESYRTDRFFDPQKKEPKEDKKRILYTFCPDCRNKAWKDPWTDHATHKDNGEDDDTFITIDGVHVFEEVITPEEEAAIVSSIDKTEWVNSQSGRRKQDFGPKLNFKKKKVNLSGFAGLPSYVKDIWERLTNQYGKDGGVLSNFLPVELCNLEYDPSRGSSIEPHFDDFWVWGTRLVTLNYLSPTALTLTRPPKEDNEDSTDEEESEIAIIMNPRSLLVLSGDARFKWLHEVKRQDVMERRVATTWRELSEEFLPGGPSYESYGKEMISIGATYI